MGVEIVIMIILHKGEILETTLDINCRLGRGTMYITNRQILIEIAGKGLVFSRMHEQMADIDHRKGAEIRLLWPENGKRCDLFLTVSKINGSRIKSNAVPHVVISHIRKNHDYRDNYPEMTPSSITSSKSSAALSTSARGAVEMGPDLRRRVIRNKILRAQSKIDVLETRLVSERKRQMHTKRNLVATALVINHIRREITWRKKYIEEIRGARLLISRRIARHPAIPASTVETNDCWFDEEYKVYCTLSKIWHTSVYHNIKHTWLKEKYGAMLENEITVIPSDNVVYIYGYPAEMQHNPSDDTLMYALLPTMTDEMLSDELVSRAYGLSTHTLEEQEGGIRRAGRIIVEPVQPDCTYDTPMSRRLDSENVFLNSAIFNDGYGGDYLMHILASVEVPALDESRFIKWCDVNNIEYLRSKLT